MQINFRFIKAAKAAFLLPKFKKKIKNTKLSFIVTFVTFIECNKY